MDIKQVHALIADEMAAVNALIQKRLHSDVVLINQLSHYIIDSGGKRMRPALLLLSARAFDYQGGFHIHLAAIIEFIHTATLLHDDVVDASAMRRGRESANTVWGNEASVLVGDFLYSRAFQMMVDVDDMAIMAILSEATNTIAIGEVQQLLNCHDPDTTEQSYLEVIRNKTAKLFQAAAQLGPMVSGRPGKTVEAMACYGMHLGTAFQLVDDLLDYSSSPEQIGKNIGDDLAEGKSTLPLIFAMRNGSPKQSEIIRRAITEGDRNSIDDIRQAIESTGAIDYTENAAREEAGKAADALSILPASKFRDALAALAEFSVIREN